MECNLKTLQDNVNQLKTRFDQIRDEAVSKLTECSDYIQTAEKLCHQAREMTTILENKFANASNEEKECQDIKVKLATKSVKGKVILDVGGEKFATSVETLTYAIETFVTALFSKQWALENDPDDKSIFIDRDGKLFHHILVYLRTNKVPNEILKNESLCDLLITEAEYYHLHALINILTSFPNGTFLQQEHKTKLNEFYGKITQRWELIYKASRDGFDGNAFNTRCNDKGPTMIIIQSNNNYLFGGYTSIPWTSDGTHKNDTTAFLFTLTNPHNITPTKYLIKPTDTGHAVRHSGSSGPTFGGSSDIHLGNGSNSNTTSYTNFPSSYTDTTGQSNNTFTSAKNFTASDIEIFKLI